MRTKTCPYDIPTKLTHLLFVVKPITEVEWLQRICEKNAVFSWFHALCLFNKMYYPYTVRVHPSVNGQATPYRSTYAMYSNWNLMNDCYDTSMILLA